MEPFESLLARLNTLAIFRPLLSQEPLQSLCAYLACRACGDARNTAASYAAFISALYAVSEGDIGRCILEQALTADTPYVRAVGRGE